MELAKIAVGYYCEVTGNSWSNFYDDLDKAMDTPIETLSDDLWLIRSLMDLLIANNISISDFKSNKDAVKAMFDEEGRKLAGEFFTPIIWAEELHRYMDKYIPNWRTTYNVWENSCYSTDTEVLTKRGWLTYDKLTLDDEVMAYNKETQETSWCGIERIFTKSAKSLIHFVAYDVTGGTGFHDEVYVDCKVTPDHLMWYYEDGVLNSSSADALYRRLKENFFLSENTKFEFVAWGRDIHNRKPETLIRVPVDYTKCKVILEDCTVWDITMKDYHIFLTRCEREPMFGSNCGSGNLIRTAGITPDHLFASSLQEDDITLIKNTPELQGCHAFQLDFLSAYDNNGNNEFLQKLPERLQYIIENNKDEPLLFLCNPPYKTGQANSTEVGRFMNSSRNIQTFNLTDFSKASYDLFYQFCFQVMNLVAQFNMPNVYYCVFGPLTWFTGAGANVLLSQFEHCFEFIDGMCISAQEFSDTSDSILWGIGATIWKSRGGYIDKPEDIGLTTFHKDILLDKKFLTPDGGIGCEGKVLYEQPREKLSDWVAPKEKDLDPVTQCIVDMPVLTSHLTFKGGELFGKKAFKKGKMRKDALGTLMVGNTLTRSADQSAILSCPTTIQYVSITEENFWRCVGSYAFRRTIDAGWAIAKKEISAPNTSVEGYEVWLRNAIVPFLFEYKSMMSSMRGVENIDGTSINIYNKLFYLTEEEIRANCHDEVILKDLDEHPLQNEFILRMIEESKPYWSPEIKQLYDWCKAYTLSTYDLRKTVNYKGSLDCADAGFQQLRSALWDSESLDNDLTKLLVQARDYMRKDLNKFGFVSEVEN